MTPPSSHGRSDPAPPAFQASSGPDQSNGKCLLDRPGQLNLKPNASTSASLTVAQVAIWPGPTSAPGGLWTCTRAPSGVVGPVSASALPHAFPGTSTRQWARSSAISKSIGANSIPHTSSISSAKPAGQPPEDRLECLALAVVGALVHEEPHGRIGRFAGPDVPVEPTDPDDVQPVERNLAVASFADVPGEDAVASSLVRWLGERTAAGHPAPAEVEPVANESPAWNLGHRFLLANGSTTDPRMTSAPDQWRRRRSTGVRRAPVATDAQRRGVQRAARWAPGPHGGWRGGRVAGSGRSEVLRLGGGDRADHLADLLLRRVRGDVGLGDHAAQPPVLVDHGQPPDLVLLHQPQRMIDRRVRADACQPVLGEFAGDRARRVLVVGDHLHDDVAVGDHALEAVVLAADRHRADV